MAGPWSFGSRNVPVLSLLLLLSFGLRAQGQTEPSATDPRLTLAETRMQEQDVLGEMDRIDRQLAGLAEEIASLQIQVDQVEARRLSAEDELAATQSHLDMQAVEVAKRCVMLYRLSRRGLARILFGSESAVELRRRTYYLLAILAHDRERLQTFSGTVARKKESLDRVDQDRAIISALQAELRLKEAGLRDERARRVAMLEDIRSTKDLAMRVMAQKASAGSSLGENLLQSSTTNTPTTADFRKAHGHLPWPTSGRLVRTFGTYDDPLTGKQAKNYGIDIEAAYGTPFRAVHDGVVSKAGFIRGYGQTVVLNHGAYSTVYAHANGLRVSLGQLVSQGDVLGFVGNSGLVDTTGYRLHFEVRYNATPQDPIDWLSPHGQR